MADTVGSRALVKANDISQSFGIGEDTIDILKHISFELKPESFNIIYGPSGSGKSTLLNILTGLQKPSSGNIIFDGEDIYRLGRDALAHFRANHIGIVYQQNYWVHSLNVLDNISLPLYFLGYTRGQAAKRALDTLDRISMRGYAKKFPTMLSGGEQQRIAMARAVVSDPLFIIADEPTGALDSKNGDMIMGLLQEAHHTQKRTIILVTHNMEYLPLADHLLHIQDGQVEELTGSTIQETTNELMDGMKQRIDRLAKAHKEGVHGQGVGVHTPPAQTDVADKRAHHAHPATHKPSHTAATHKHKTKEHTDV